jgi:hypothetical protein
MLAEKQTRKIDMYQFISANGGGISGGATENGRENSKALFVARANVKVKPLAKN